MNIFIGNFVIQSHYIIIHALIDISFSLDIPHILETVFFMHNLFKFNKKYMHI